MKQRACENLAVVIASVFVISGLLLNRLQIVRATYEVVWFEPLLLQLGFAWLAVFLLLGTIHDRATSGSSIFLPSTWRTSLSRHAPLTRVGRYLSVALVLPPFISTFAGFKQSIPDWNPFSWDESFFRLDRAIHGGHLPSDLGSALFRRPEVTIFLDQVYYWWFPVLILTVTWFAWADWLPVRSQFLLNYFLVWIVFGIGAAILFSSAGPCFYASVVPGPDPYGDLMEYLRRTAAVHDLTTIQAQDYLWAGYSSRQISTEGISAMPSMHVAMATLFCIAGFQTNRLLGFAYGLFLCLIIVGSVQLGWHYAVDGYVSIVLVLVLWRLTGELMENHTCR